MSDNKNSQNNNEVDGARFVEKRECDDYSRPEWLVSDVNMDKDNEETELIKEFSFISFLDKSNEFIRNVMCKSNATPKNE